LNEVEDQVYCLDEVKEGVAAEMHDLQFKVEQRQHHNVKELEAMCKVAEGLVARTQRG